MACARRGSAACNVVLISVTRAGEGERDFDSVAFAAGGGDVAVGLGFWCESTRCFGVRASVDDFSLCAAVAASVHLAFAPTTRTFAVGATWLAAGTRLRVDLRS